MNKYDTARQEVNLRSTESKFVSLLHEPVKNEKIAGWLCASFSSASC